MVDVATGLAGERAGREITEAAGEAAITGARRAGVIAGDIAGALEESAERGFRRQAEDIAVPGLEEMTKRERQALRPDQIQETFFGGRAVSPEVVQQ